MNCRLNDEATCVRCGYKAASLKVKRMCPSAGLGDAVEAVLESVGVTKERVSRVASIVGVKDCGCEKRKQYLNEVGKMVGLGITPQDSQTDGSLGNVVR
jgi:hypothetical protein